MAEPVAKVALDAMAEALKPRTRNEWEDLGFPYEAKDPICWDSTINYINLRCGGFYGLTTVAAEKGTGKSFLATASSIEAAASGQWQVVSFIAEEDRDGYRARFNRYLSVHPHARRCIGELYPFFVGKGQTPESMYETIQGAVDWESDKPVLTVVDSINSVVNLSGRNYLKTLADYSLWMMFARRLSGGRAAFLVTSETNHRGGAKGEALPFWSDVYLLMRKESDTVVSMRLEKTRRTGGEGPMGKFIRNVRTGLFESEHFQGLQAVE